MSRPLSDTWPPSIFNIPEMQFTKVLFPDPFGPMSPKRSPG